MKKNRFVKGLVAGAGFFFLSAAPSLTRAQSLPPAPAQTPRKVSPARVKKAPGPMDDFAGLDYSDEQKAKISQIHEDMLARMETVRKDDKLSPEQKGAMIQGYQHMERGEVYKVLTREQQMIVRKRILTRRTETMKEQEEKNKQAVPVPTQHSPTQQLTQPSQSSKPPQPPPA